MCTQMRLRTRMVIHSYNRSTHAGTVRIRENKREVVCGADIYEQFFLAIILSKDGKKFQDRFNMNFEGFQNLRQWLPNNGCLKLAIESTTNYWPPIYFILGRYTEFVLANAYFRSSIFLVGRHVLDSE